MHVIVAELDDDVRREQEAALIDLYYECLYRHGVTDLTRERLWFQCRLSLLWLHFMLFNVAAMPDLQQIMQAEAETAGDDWRDWIFGQLGPATEDWKQAEAIDQAIEEAKAGQA